MLIEYEPFYFPPKSVLGFCCHFSIELLTTRAAVEVSLLGYVWFFNAGAPYKPKRSRNVAFALRSDILYAKAMILVHRVALYHLYQTRVYRSMILGRVEPNKTHGAPLAKRASIRVSLSVFYKYRFVFEVHRSPQVSLTSET